MHLNKDISNEIKDIFDNNMLNDLKRFIQKRQCLNTTNSYLIYLFHFVQSAGILTSSVAAGNNNTNLIWLGIALNFLATLVHIYEKTNNSILKKLLVDIESIKAGTYVDESEMVNISSISTSTKNKDTSESIPITNPMIETASSYNTFSTTNISPISTSSSPI